MIRMPLFFLVKARRNLCIILKGQGRSLASGQGTHGYDSFFSPFNSVSEIFYSAQTHDSQWLYKSRFKLIHDSKWIFKI